MHTGALGWNGFLTFGMIWLLPRLFQAEIYSKRLMEMHFGSVPSGSCCTSWPSTVPA